MLDLDSLIRAELSPTMKYLGFKKKGRKWTDGVIFVSIQLSSSNGIQDIPYKFTVNFDSIDSDGTLGHARIGRLFSPNDTDAILSIQQKIFSESPPLPREADQDHLGYLLGKRVLVDPMLGTDFWMNYWTNEHLAAWLHFLAEQIPSCVAKFRKGPPDFDWYSILPGGESVNLVDVHCGG
jgi:hypothetical protein